MIERKADRRQGVSSWFTCPVNDRRRPQFERRVGLHAPVAPGAVRVGFAEAMPRVDRRKFPDVG